MWVYCDVRDLAQGFRLALEDDTLENETFFITADERAGPRAAGDAIAALPARHRGDGARADRDVAGRRLDQGEAAARLPAAALLARIRPLAVSEFDG